MNSFVTSTNVRIKEKNVTSEEKCWKLSFLFLALFKMYFIFCSICTVFATELKNNNKCSVKKLLIRCEYQTDAAFESNEN